MGLRLHGYVVEDIENANELVCAAAVSDFSALSKIVLGRGPWGALKQRLRVSTEDDEMLEHYFSECWAKRRVQRTYPVC